MLMRNHPTKRPWRPRQHWQFTQAFGVKRSYTWFTKKGMEAAERRLENYVSSFARMSDEQLARLLAHDYDGPWVEGRGAPLLKDRCAE